MTLKGQLSTQIESSAAANPLDIIGADDAPEEIRTPDPQIRSLEFCDTRRTAGRWMRPKGNAGPNTRVALGVTLYLRRFGSAFDRCCRKSRKLSSSPNLAKDDVCLPSLLQASVARVPLWSPSCDSTWSLTSERAACTGGAEKCGSPARKTFFDSIDQWRHETVPQSVPVRI
jgi:hypothetical protein